MCGLDVPNDSRQVLEVEAGLKKRERRPCDGSTGNGRRKPDHTETGTGAQQDTSDARSLPHCLPSFPEVDEIFSQVIWQSCNSHLCNALWEGTRQSSQSMSWAQA